MGINEAASALDMLKQPHLSILKFTHIAEIAIKRH
jgi:hypothetical protein